MVFGLTNVHKLKRFIKFTELLPKPLITSMKKLLLIPIFCLLFVLDIQAQTTTISLVPVSEDNSLCMTRYLLMKEK
jgi:hypothetical protein